MGARMQCFSCQGAGRKMYGRVNWDCMACHGTGSIELPLDEFVDALKPHITAGVNLLKKRLIASVQQRKFQKALESSLKNIGR